ncbi:MAG: outer membrane protein assembly factor BamD, partial [Nitrospinota bacterium]
MQRATVTIIGKSLLICLCLLLPLQARGGQGDAPPPELVTALDALEQKDYRTVVESLEPLLARGLSPRWKQRVIYLLGHANLKLERYPDALVYLTIAVANYPQMADYAAFNIARIFKALGYNFLYTENLQLLLTRYPFSRLAPQLRLSLAQEEFAQEEFREAIRLLQDFQTRYGKTEQTPEALFLLAQAWEKLGKPEQALALYRDLYFHFPTDPQARRAAERIQALDGKQFADLATAYPEQMLERGERLLQAREYREAARTFQTLLNRNSLPEKRAALLLKLSTAYRSLGQWKQAITTLKKVPQSTKDPLLQQESWYRLGRVYQRRRRFSSARVYFQKVLQRSPPSPWTWRTLYRLGQMAENQGQPARAIRWYRKLVKEFPQSDLAPEALWRMGWLNYTARRFSRAAEYFQQLSSAYSHSSYRDNALFWLGKIQEKRGKKREAIVTYRLLAFHYPYTYYGYRAEERLRHLTAEELLQVNDFFPPPEDKSSLGDYSSLPPEIRFHFDRATELTLLRFREDAQAEIKILHKLLPPSSPYRFLLSQLYFQLGRYLDSIQILNASLERLGMEKRLQLPAPFWRLLFPRLYWPQIQQAAVEHDIDPYLILSVIRQESAFQEDAHSRSDARGLMQLIPRTGRSIYRDVIGGRLRKEQLFEPEINITLGTAYLARLLRAYNGNLILALAAYNAGTGRVN